MSVRTKRCARCRAWRPVSNFPPGKKWKDGLHPYCRPCRRAAGREASKRRRDKIRQWEREHTTPCVDCGALTSDGYRERRPSQRCADCEYKRRHANAHERTARWLDLRWSGMNNREIAAREGVSEQVVATILCRTQVARFPDLTWTRSPYNRPVEP